MPAELRRRVAARAAGRCEYCLLPAEAEVETFHVDHTRPRWQGGRTTWENLALACPVCNGGKHASIAAYDPETDRPAFLFDPRRDAWADHFRLLGRRIEGRTAAGRATVWRLGMNEPAQQLKRARAVALGFTFP